MSFARYTPRNLEQFRAKFARDRDCYDYLFSLRQHVPFRCQREGCDSNLCRRMERNTASGKRAFRVCKKCGFQESAMTGTIFQRSRLPLKDWFHIIWWAAATQNGLSAAQFGNEVGRKLCIEFGSAATPYHCVQGIRKVMANVPRLADSVHLGLVRLGNERFGTIHNPKLVGLAISTWYKASRMAVLPDTKPETMLSFAAATVEPQTAVVTSGWIGYNCLAQAGYRHSAFSPAAETQESAFFADYRLAGLVSGLRAWLANIGWGAIDKRNLPGYLAEFSFRHSCARRGGNTGFRFVKLLRQALEFPYKSYQAFPA
jgi:hypothetical protein